ncbi:DNA mismatch repair protein MSH2, putative [Plasmodium gaboni]|uniref:DNA mismatch repair protein MSH2, putative n=1 Tax=Plasmodium gaboni TaxID=647221 RepID=A0ABY1UNJ3_9APIC|nr:DNA mismatch repair protein MSH2, putative [Plasmodium gaboni]
MSTADESEDKSRVISFNLDVRNNIRYVGICIYDIYSNEFSLCEYIENEHFTVLESILLQTRPSSFLYLSNNEKVDEKRIHLILNLCDIKYKELPKIFYESGCIENDLMKLLKGSDIKHCVHFLSDLQLACKSLCSIIKDLDLLNDNSSINKCILKNYHINKYLKLDKAAMIALNIYDDIHMDHSSNKNTSKTNPLSANTLTLYKFLNKCKTKIGQRKLLNWIIHPIRDEQKINERLDMVQIFKEDNITRSIIQSDYLRKVCDLQIIIKKFKTTSGYLNDNNINNNDNNMCDHNNNSMIMKKKNNNIIFKGKHSCTLEDLVKLYDTIVVSKKIYYLLNDYKGTNENTLNKKILKPLCDCLIKLEPYLKLIELTIDFEEIEIQNNYLISRTFDENLDLLATQKDNIYNLIKEHKFEVEEDIQYLKGKQIKKKPTSANKLIGGQINNTNNTYNTNYNNIKEDIKLVECNANIFLFRAVKKDINYIQERKNVYIQVRMNKNEILFHTNKLKNLCRQYEHILNQYNIIQESLAHKAIQVACSYWEPIITLSKILSEIDIFCSFGFISSSSISTYVRPEIQENGNLLHMKNSRHPLVESNLLLINNFIPNDVYMDKELTRLNIITGPNMGGKSTYIRQIALICVMAHIGCFVPCTFAKIPILTQIMCRVGSSDIQLKGISTFFSEMIEISAIIKNADQNTLIIIDELGRGTSTYEGFGISWSVAYYILNTIKCFCLFATHFHEMSNLEDEYKGVTNNHVGAKIDTHTKKISFLYEIKKGYADKSYGVYVAQIAQLPKTVIDKAFQKSKELESVENRHYFKKKLLNHTNQHNNTNHTSNHNKYISYLKDIFSVTNEHEFLTSFKKYKEQINNILNDI